MHSLPVFLRLQGRPVILIGSGEAAEAKQRLLERAGARIVDEADGAARLAIVAEDADAPALAAIARLQARGILINAVDRSDYCDFTLPAIVDRDPVVIAIGTGGASAGLAKAVRQRLEALIPAGLGTVAATLGAARTQLRAKWRDPAERRRAIDAALAPGGPLDPLADRSAEDVARWLSGPASPDTGGRIATIRLTGDDPDLLTLRDARLLGQADAVWHRPDVPDAVLARARADAVRVEADGPPDTPSAGLWLWVERIAG